MSLRVLVIPEDPTYNGYILKPLIQAVLEDIGKPGARIQVLTNPRLQGYDHALQEIRGGLVDRYGFWDIWIFVPDSDRAGADAMGSLEVELAGKGVALFCCPAHPEVEIYACVAYRADLGMSWEDARAATNFKESVFHPLLKRHGDPRRAGGGRDMMIAESLRNRRELYRRCPELAALRDRIAARIRTDGSGENP